MFMSLKTTAPKKYTEPIFNLWSGQHAEFQRGRMFSTALFYRISLTVSTSRTFGKWNGFEAPGPSSGGRRTISIPVR
jgi:hypothetical protein